MTEAIAATGATLAEAFARASLAVLGRAVDPAVVEPRDVREVRAHGSSVEALFGAWIEECRYVHELESFACHAVEFAVFDAAPTGGTEQLRVHGLLRGEEIDADRHGEARPIGAPRDVRVERTAAGYRITLSLGP